MRDKEETGSWVVPVHEGTLSQNNDVGAGLSLRHGAAAGGNLACRMGERGVAVSSTHSCRRVRVLAG